MKEIINQTEKELWLADIGEIIEKQKIAWKYLDRRYEAVQTLFGHVRLKYGDDHEITKDKEEEIVRIGDSLSEMSHKINALEEWCAKGIRYHSLIEEGSIEEALEMNEDLIATQPSEMDLGDKYTNYLGHGERIRLVGVSRNRHEAKKKARLEEE